MNLVLCFPYHIAPLKLVKTSFVFSVNSGFFVWSAKNYLKKLSPT